MTRGSAGGLCTRGQALGATNKEQGRLENCGVVMQEILDIPDNIPQSLVDKAECVIVIPSMTKIALGIGGSYGRGAMVCRTGKTFKGPWGAPAMYSLEGGSFGLQLGGESTDVVLLVMNNRGAEALPRRDPQLLARARPVRGHLARGHVASPRRRSEYGRLRTEADRATDRDGNWRPRSRLRPSPCERAAEARAAQRIGDGEPIDRSARGTQHERRLGVRLNGAI